MSVFTQGSEKRGKADTRVKMINMDFFILICKSFDNSNSAITFWNIEST